MYFWEFHSRVANNTVDFWRSTRYLQCSTRWNLRFGYPTPSWWIPIDEYQLARISPEFDDLQWTFFGRWPFRSEEGRTLSIAERKAVVHTVWNLPNNCPKNYFVTGSCTPCLPQNSQNFQCTIHTYCRAYLSFFSMATKRWHGLPAVDELANLLTQIQQQAKDNTKANLLFGCLFYSMIKMKNGLWWSFYVHWSSYEWTSSICNGATVQLLQFFRISLNEWIKPQSKPTPRQVVAKVSDGVFLASWMALPSSLAFHDSLMVDPLKKVNSFWELWE